jgi:hypothetical protein
MLRVLTMAAGLAAAATAAQAASVGILSYDMRNGTTGSYNYWDESYTGSGSTTTDGAPLSGGVGDLTDGYVETRNWNHPDVEPPAGPGPYVGWLGFSPVITFTFDAVYQIDSVTFYVDDSNNAGGVRTPESVRVGSETFAIADPAGAAPFGFTATLAAPLMTDMLELQINRRGGSWVFVSEIEFNGMPNGGTGVIPVPAALPLLASGLAALGFAARRRG